MTRPSRRLPREFYARPTLDVARDLIGKVLVHDSSAGRTAGVIVETEAYIGEGDPACHAAPGPTKRNAPLYGPPGIAYVYLNYGMHFLVNAVTEPVGHPAAVLLRALEPLEGHALMHERRCRAGRAVAEHELCRGPGNLTKALGISLVHNQLDFIHSTLTIEDRGLDTGPVVWTRRIGIRLGADRSWRAAADRHPAVSGSPALWKEARPYPRPRRRRTG